METASADTRIESTRQWHTDEALVDAEGVPLCSHAIWGRRCRWRKSCSYSHNVPSEIVEAYRAHARCQVEEVALHRLSNIPDAFVPEWLSQLQRHSIAYSYDTTLWPLRDALREVFELCPGENLEDLHRRELTVEPPLCPALLQAFVATRGFNALPLDWQVASKKIDIAQAAMVRSKQFSDFLRLYDEFCAHVIVPLTGDTAAYVQRPPSLRVHLAGQPQARGKIGMHKDADYPGHSPHEINFWVPLVTCSGNNSLHVESVPGACDFRSLDLGYGEFFRFHGYSCQHHTVANNTGTTRVSFDLRAIPVSSCPVAVLRGCRRGGQNLRIGDYAAVLMHAPESADSKDI